MSKSAESILQLYSNLNKYVYQRGPKELHFSLSKVKTRPFWGTLVDLRDNVPAAGNNATPPSKC